MGGRIARDADVIDVLDANAGLVETITNRLDRKSGAVLDAVEALLFDRGYKLSVANNGCRCVPVISVDTENDHKRMRDCEFRIVKLSALRTLLFALCALFVWIGV